METLINLDKMINLYIFFYLDGATVDSEICHVVCDEYSINNSTFLFFKLFFLCVEGKWADIEDSYINVFSFSLSLFECIYMYVRCLCVFKERWAKVITNRSKKKKKIKFKDFILSWLVSWRKLSMFFSIFQFFFLFVIVFFFCSLSVCLLPLSASLSSSFLLFH
jgi:hypothetical protein